MLMARRMQFLGLQIYKVSRKFECQDFMGRLVAMPRTWLELERDAEIDEEGPESRGIEF